MKKTWFEETIKQYVESEDYKFISMITDKGLNSRIMIQCNEGHPPYEVSFKNFKGNKSKSPTRCPYCNGGVAYSDEYIKSSIEIGLNPISVPLIISPESFLEILFEKSLVALEE